MVRIYDTINDKLKPKWLLISRLFLATSLIFLFLIVVQIIDDFMAINIGIKLFNVGYFNHKVNVAYDLIIVIYTVGFVFIYIGLLLIRRNFLISYVNNQSKKKSTNTIFTILLIIEAIHLFSIIIMDILGTYVVSISTIAVYFICSLILNLTPLVYTITLGYLYRNIDLITVQ